MRPREAYDEILRRTREESLLLSCAELLGWDEETYMPRGGAEHRGNQLALLAGLAHRRATDPALGELLGIVEDSPLVADPDSPEAVNVREIRRLYQRQTRLPRSLVEELARTTSLAQQAWLTAREERSFVPFRPWLEKVIALKRREAACLTGGEPSYDALLEEYEPGLTSTAVVRLFEALRHDLLPLVGALAATRGNGTPDFLHRPVPLERQRILGEMAAAAVGFDFRRGRLDTTTHPFFSSIGPGDCRITTRYAERDFSAGFFALLHEVGHGLYEQGLDPEHRGTPVGEATSLGLHESQARLWENTVGRSRAFWRHFFPIARQSAPDVFRGITLDTWYAAVNRVAPSVNRVRADEVTYNLHILLRFELERALLALDLAPADVPAAWNEAYRHYLGVTPADDVEGCLQDGHWGAGLFGYFPTYTLGNVFAAQLFARAEEDLGSLDEAFARGDFAGLLEWLRTHVYRQGSRYRAAELIERVTGSPPDHRPLVRALRRKYGALHGV